MLKLIQVNPSCGSSEYSGYLVHFPVPRPFSSLKKNTTTTTTKKNTCEKIISYVFLKKSSPYKKILVLQDSCTLAES